jgi:transposase
VYCISTPDSTATPLHAVNQPLVVDKGAIMAVQLNQPTIFGCDISSTDIVIACPKVDANHSANRPVKTIANKTQAINSWLATIPKEAIIGMEATGRYHDQLADIATLRGHCVYVINPKHLSHYAKGLGQRGKTDPLDANVIARYVTRERDRLHAYTVPTASQRMIRQLLSQRSGMVKHANAIRQCMRATELPAGAALQQAQREALDALSKLIAALEAQLKSLVNADTELEAKRMKLQTIHGIGLLNSLALTHRFDRTPFANSDAVVAAYGLDPRPKDSGKMTGKRRLTKQGNAEDRRLIYLAAQSAVKTKVFKPIYQALRAKGFATTEAIVIIARKLLRIAFAVWTSNKPFDPTKIGSGACKKT